VRREDIDTQGREGERRRAISNRSVDVNSIAIARRARSWGRTLGSYGNGDDNLIAQRLEETGQARRGKPVKMTSVDEMTQRQHETPADDRPNSKHSKFYSVKFRVII